MPEPVYHGPSCLPYGTVPGAESYAYSPSLSAGITFSIIFALITLRHTTHYIHALLAPAAYLPTTATTTTSSPPSKTPKRIHYMLLLIAGAALECTGWIARAVAHACPYSSPLATMQISTLIMGPAWTQAAVYVACWALVLLLGRRTVPVPATLYLWTSFAADVVCLGLQAAGGGLAGSAAAAGGDTRTGTTVMVVGIIAQLGVAVAFSAVLAVVVWRGWSGLVGRGSDPAVRRVAAAMVVCTAMMVLRGVYRSIELVQGWRGYLISREVYVIVLDAAPMVVAMGALAIFTPAALLVRAGVAEAEENMVRASKGACSSGESVQTITVDEKAEKVDV
ncbi:hypothetical protein FH972_022104 [Carpinus fangiana]|uniref:THH1/TOM1/TOM3 domain-containing protein n=1 Tax=Carpinus fangiana TaxID=176857 RepID=A0A5N6KRU1_9ROSI|nr:hypothetical protein FH972_022104 [Carpinus fangiana]